MAQRQALTVRIDIDGVRETLRAFNRLPQEANAELRERTFALSRSLARHVETAARAEGGQAPLMAPTVKAHKDRVPFISAGGSKRVGRHRVPAYKLIFASEFGMNRRSGWYAAARYRGSAGRQYKPHGGRGSYWMFKTVEAHNAEINLAWNRIADDIVRSFARDGAP